MIEEIRIRNLGVIAEAVLAPGPGFTAVTGETGAGKTMVVTALGLLLGARGDPGVVRAGAERAEVEGRLSVGGVAEVSERVEELGGELDGDVLIVARSLPAQGRGRAWAGGRTVPAGALGELTGRLVAVHGQDDQQRLLAPARQRAALDRFAGDAVARPLAGYRADYARLRAVEAGLAGLESGARERAREADILAHGLAEIDAAAPEPDEEERLDAEAWRLAHAEALRRDVLQAHGALSADPGTDAPDALALLGAASRDLESATVHDAALRPLAERLAEAAALAGDVAAELASYAASMDVDPARLDEVEQRRAVLRGLRRRYGDSTADVLAWAAAARARLADVGGHDERAGLLRAERTALRGRLAEAAAALTGARAAAGEALARAVSAELAGLAMPRARLEVDLRRTPDPEGLDTGDGTWAFGPDGVDEAELLLAPHAGAPARPVARGASGGELSRVMLALEVVFAGTDGAPTLVFDEVDAGVGGRAAVEVGRRLARLARTAQVLVVTHLPQVAAFADHHLVVRKDDDGLVTTSAVDAVDAEHRVRELARMLAGQETSATAAAHAAELLDLAAADR